jgi:hypothetical protein
VNTFYELEEWRGEQRIIPQGIMSPLGDKVLSWRLAPKTKDSLHERKKYLPIKGSKPAKI